jgi:hypothetical protein
MDGFLLEKGFWGGEEKEKCGETNPLRHNKFKPLLPRLTGRQNKLRYVILHIPTISVYPLHLLLPPPAGPACAAIVLTLTDTE